MGCVNTISESTGSSKRQVLEKLILLGCTNEDGCYSTYEGEGKFYKVLIEKPEGKERSCETFAQMCDDTVRTNRKQMT